MSEAAPVRRLSPAAVSPLSLPLFILVSAVLVCLGTEWVCRAALHYISPLYIEPLRVEEIRFPDLLAFYPRFALLHTEAFFTSTATNHFMYPAAAVPLYQMFYAAAPHMVDAYLASSLGALLLAAFFVIRGLVRRGMQPATSTAYVALTLLCAYPIWFALSQANIEIVLWVLLAGGVALYWQGRGYPAAVCFGLAAAIKIYPALFFVLPLYRRQWGQAALGAIVAAAYSFGSLFYVGPTLSQASSGIAAGLNLFRAQYMLTVRSETGIDHSLFGCYKFAFRNHVASARFEQALPLYLGVAAAAVLTLLLTRVRQLPLTNQLAFCIVVCLLFPPTSFEYTLLHILTLNALLLFVFLDAARARVEVPGLFQALLCCSVCLAFLPELIRHGYQLDGPIKSMVLLLLLFTVLRHPFPAAAKNTTGTLPQNAEALG